MDRNIDLTVNKVTGGYCIRCTRKLDAPQLFWSPRPYSADLFPLGAMRGQEMWVPTPDENTRPYFCVQSEGASALWAADTAVEIHAVENFRDMGGYRTEDGRTVKWGRFFRCGGIFGMDARETRIYEGMRIRNIYDYRATDEAQALPDVYTAQTAYHLVPAIMAQFAEESGLSDMDMASRLQSIHTPEDAEALYQGFLSLYGILPFGNPAYREMLGALDSEETVPIIQHCSAGKDRTGVGCALLLLSLGVAEETVLEDYLLSAILRADVNRRYVDEMAKKGLNEHALALVARMMTVTRDMLETSFGAMREKHGSIDAFLAAEYDVTPERRAKWEQLHTVSV